MASSIFFSGRLISTPGSYTDVDASGLESVGLGASGIVGLIGTAEGGKPWTAVGDSDVKSNLQVANRPEDGRKFFRSGDLRNGADFLFGPSADAGISAGAQSVIFVKVNPAAKSAASFDNADGEALILSSKDWGYFTTQIMAQIASGTSQGKMLTITLEDLEEVFDDVGGDSIFTLTYAASTPADGFTTVTAEITASALKTLFTRDQIGLDNEVTTVVTPGQIIELVSSSASDTAVQVRLFGTDATDATQVVTKTLAGLSVVSTTETWNEFHGAEIVSGTLIGTLTIQNLAAASTISTIAPAGTEAGIEFTVDHAVSGSAVSVAADAGTTKRITLFGRSSTGAFQTEVLVLTGATPVAGVALWNSIEGLALGELEAARTLTVSGTSVNALFSGLGTVKKLADKYNGTAGYTLATVIGNASAFLSTDLDFQAATDIKGPALLSASADLAAIISKLNSSSALVVASKGSVASGAPSNTAAAVFLTGGHEGSAVPGQEAIPTATATDWQGAFDLLKKVTLNTLVPLTGDPAVHAMGKAHCQYMGGVGRGERDMIVGLLNTAQDDVPTKAEAKSQIVDLNTRHVRAVAQAIERFDSFGERKEFLPPFAACNVAGMQAGSAVGTSLTHKYTDVLKVRQDSTWNPEDDSEELIQAGLLMFETIDGVGRRVVRNITTHLTSNNIAFTEGSVNEAVNFSVLNLRNSMERFIGAPGFAGTVNAAQGVAIGALGLLSGVTLTAWRSLDLQLVLDVLEMSVEISPVLPINFVQSTIHLVTIPQSAAA